MANRGVSWVAFPLLFQIWFYYHPATVVWIWTFSFMFLFAELDGNRVKDSTPHELWDVNREAVRPKPQTILFPTENVLLGWRENVRPGAGMINMGNTCYINSVLQVRKVPIRLLQVLIFASSVWILQLLLIFQALFHIPAMVNWLLGDTEHREKCKQKCKYRCPSPRIYFLQFWHNVLKVLLFRQFE